MMRCFLHSQRRNLRTSPEIRRLFKLNWDRIDGNFRRSRAVRDTFEARASKLLGSKRVMVVVSEDGFDEISPCFKTKVFEIDEEGTEKHYDISPADYGIESCNDNDLAGGTASENAKIALDLLTGKGNVSVKHAVCLKS